MACSLILPELLVGLEFQNRMMASKSVKEMEEYSRQDEVEWTLTHIFFANVGGFVLKVKLESSEKEQLLYPTASDTCESSQSYLPIST